MYGKTEFFIIIRPTPSPTHQLVRKRFYVNYIARSSVIPVHAYLKWCSRPIFMYLGLVLFNLITHASGEWELTDKDFRLPWPIWFRPVADKWLSVYMTSFALLSHRSFQGHQLKVMSKTGYSLSYRLLPFLVLLAVAQMYVSYHNLLIDCSCNFVFCCRKEELQ